MKGTYMRVVQINTVYGSGSTGKIAAALFKAAAAEGYESYAVYGRGSKRYGSRNFYRTGNIADFTGHVLVNFFAGKSGFGSKRATSRLLKWLDCVQPDILHLHNIHGFYVHVGMLFDYIREHDIPVVWTLHDCWAFTGQCAYFDYAGCTRWKTGCYNCPVYRRDYPYSLFKDNSLENYQLKRVAFTGVRDMTIVTPSKWLAGLVGQSFLKDYPLEMIPNGINLEIFKPVKEIGCRKKKIILGVANVWSRRKGLEDFLELAQILDDCYHIVLIGVSAKQKTYIAKNFPRMITPIQRTENQQELAEWYSKAVVYVNPTWEDNFPTTNIEALACGTPVVTYRTGGSPECIDEACGMVVSKGDINGIKAAVDVLSGRYPEICVKCLEKAKEYNEVTRFRDYVQLYGKILRRCGGKVKESLSQYEDKCHYPGI